MSRSLIRERVSATRRTFDDARHTKSSPASRRSLERKATRRRQASASVLSHALVTNHNHEEDDEDDDDDDDDNDNEGVGAHPTLNAPAFQQFAESTFHGESPEIAGSRCSEKLLIPLVSMLII